MTRNLRFGLCTGALALTPMLFAGCSSDSSGSSGSAGKGGASGASGSSGSAGQGGASGVSGSSGSGSAGKGGASGASGSSGSAGKGGASGASGSSGDGGTAGGGSGGQAGGGALCGNGDIDEGEDCDDENTVTEACTYGQTSCVVCSAGCSQVVGATSYCGDGALDTDNAEACDDGNVAAQDGCSGACVVEPGWTCGGSPSACFGRSCSGLQPTCGTAGDDYCCESNVIPGGTFNRSNDAAYPATVSDFRLDTYEITVGRFRNFVAAYSQSMIAAGAGKNPNDAADTGWSTAWNASLPADAAALTSAVQCGSDQTWTGGNDSRPMNCINWFETNAFCIWDGGRLPTEAEWNYAAAGGSEQRAYPWGAAAPGTNASLAVYGCYYNGAGVCAGVTNIAPVGSVTAGNGRWGQTDLAGNVWEWILDWHASPYSQTCTNCANLTPGAARVVRGGSFDGEASFLLSAFRNSYGTPTDRSGTIGARCARTP